MLFLVTILACGGLAVATITGAAPPSGSCMCLAGTGINIRSTACGEIIGSGNTGQCYTSRGQRQVCTLSGASHEFYAFDYGSQIGWVSGDYLNTAANTQCQAGGGNCASVNIVSRAEWGARPPSSSIPTISLPVSMLFIHHTEGSHGTTQSTCSSIMRSIQDYHMDSNGWSDIGYNFLVCEDGSAYEGRGWNKQGAHTSGYNSVAVAISVIGSYMTRLPNAAALATIRNLMDCARNQGVLSAGYDMWGHRDGGSTDCPGDALYAHIQTWPEYSTSPPRQ